MGGYDFLEKPFNAEKITIAVKRCLELSSIKQRLRLAEARTAQHDIIGDSPPMRKLIEATLRVAATSASVLITGESGTGKELIANTIHAQSERRNEPIVKVNCSAIPDSLLESELFGYERGAFTGAQVGRRGLFELAHRGSIFLDEVADLSPSAQVKLLRVLQNGEIQKIGSERTIQVDVRTIAGTHKDLKSAVQQGLFREDLYYRLNVVPIKVPSLRERLQDIPTLIGYFCKRIGERHNLKPKSIDDAVMLEMQHYHWPGNVRELQNVLERMLILSGDTISIRDLPGDLLSQDDNLNGEVPSALKQFRDHAEREFVIATLRRNKGNISQSAIELGVGRSYLHRRLAVLKISKRDFFG